MIDNIKDLIMGIILGFFLAIAFIATICGDGGKGLLDLIL
jgi:hypothetical protein